MQLSKRNKNFDSLRVVIKTLLKNIAGHHCRIWRRLENSKRQKRLKIIRSALLCNCIKSRSFIDWNVNITMQHWKLLSTVLTLDVDIKDNHLSISETIAIDHHVSYMYLCDTIIKVHYFSTCVLVSMLSCRHIYIPFSCLSDRGIPRLTSAWKTLSFTTVHGRLPVFGDVT